MPGMTDAPRREVAGGLHASQNLPVGISLGFDRQDGVAQVLVLRPREMEEINLFVGCLGQWHVCKQDA